MLFISPQKLIPFSRYSSFCLDFLVMYQNGLIKVNFKFNDVTAWLTKNCSSMLSNTSRSKINQTMKFDQLIECNMKNIFLEISCITCGGETSHRPFCEKLKLSISLDQQFKVLYSLLLLYGKLRATEYIETKPQTTCFPHIKLFSKNKKGSETSLPVSLPA